MTKVQEVIATLKNILDNPDFYNKKHYMEGLCLIIRKIHGEPYERLLKASFKSYDLYSGDCAFPVPHPDKSPMGAYLTDNLWDLQNMEETD